MFRKRRNFRKSNHILLSKKVYDFKKISFKMKILTFMYLTSVNREMEQFSKYVEIKKKGGGTQ